MRQTVLALGRRQIPADPVTQRTAHDQLLVALGEPGQLGEMGDAVLPRAWHAGDVGAPEHALRAERVVDRPVASVQAAERIAVVRIAGTAGRLDGNVWMAR